MIRRDVIPSPVRKVFGIRIRVYFRGDNVIYGSGPLEHEGISANGASQRVKDDWENMKIKNLRTFLVPPRWLFLKIDTDEGLSGWGEPVLEGRAQTVAAAVDELADYLVGKDPAPIEDHWNVLYRGGFYRGGGVHMSALAGIDQALWDLRGKALGQPVHRLLGGPVRGRPSELTRGSAVIVQRTLLKERG